MHGDVTCQLGVAAFQSYYNTDLVAVQVSINNVAFDAGQATDVYVLAYFTNQNQTISFLRSDQRSCVGQLVSESFFYAVSNEFFEVVLQSQEVGLRVNFKNNGRFAIFSNFNCDSAFSSNVACFFGSLDGARSTHVINGFFDVAASLGQGFLAIHHAFASTLTQFFNQRCSNLCHFKIPLG